MCWAWPSSSRAYMVVVCVSNAIRIQIRPRGVEIVVWVQENYVPIIQRVWLAGGVLRAFTLTIGKFQSPEKCDLCAHDVEFCSCVMCVRLSYLWHLCGWVYYPMRAFFCGSIVSFFYCDERIINFFVWFIPWSLYYIGRSFIGSVTCFSKNDDNIF